MTQSGDGRDGETDQMLAYQVSLHCPEWQDIMWSELLGVEGRAVFKLLSLLLADNVAPRFTLSSMKLSELLPEKQILQFIWVFHIL